MRDDLERLRRMARGEEAYTPTTGLLLNAIEELARREDYLLRLYQMLGFSQRGWEDMEHWLPRDASLETQMPQDYRSPPSVPGL